MQRCRLNKRMLSDWVSAALQTSRKCERYAGKYDVVLEDNNSRTANGSDDEKNT